MLRFLKLHLESSLKSSIEGLASNSLCILGFNHFPSINISQAICINSSKKVIWQKFHDRNKSIFSIRNSGLSCLCISYKSSQQFLFFNFKFFLQISQAMSSSNLFHILYIHSWTCLNKLHIHQTAQPSKNWFKI